MELLPLRVVDKMLALTEFAAFGNLKKWGLRKHPQGGATRLVESETAPAIDNGFVAALKAGRFTVVPEIERFEGNRVYLADGNSVEPDIVVAATGYRPGLESMLGHLGVLDRRGVPVANGAEPLAGYPGLWFIGMRPRLAGFFYLAGRTAREITDAIVARRDAGDAGGRVAEVAARPAGSQAA
jgi:cation diffusion facilitator CzcD-associated flavoprotein CzcO